MTFAGKILVIVIAAMSLIFLGISTVALTTHPGPDWKKPIGDQNKANQEIQADLTKATAELNEYQAKLKTAQQEHAGATKAIEDQIARLAAETRQGQGAIAKADEALLKLQADAKVALQDVDAKNQDIIKLRAEVAAVEEQARKFKLRQDEYDAEIVNLRRMLEAARTNAGQIHQSH